jgi:lipoate---protein ligase
MNESAAMDAARHRLTATEFDILRTGPLTAVDNLALDETLLFRVASGARKPLLWFWDWDERAVILGSYQSVREEIDAQVAEEQGFTFARRVSGGGAMVVEPGRSITYSMIVPESAVEGLSFVDSFAVLDTWCVDALRALGVQASYRPINDIAAPDGGKIGGAAQCRRRRTVLHHTTIAWELDGALMWRLLRLDAPRPRGGGIPSAVKVVSPLSRFTSLSRAEVVDHLAASFAVRYRTTLSEILPEEESDAAARRREKFDTPAWRYRVP